MKVRELYLGLAAPHGFRQGFINAWSHGNRQAWCLQAAAVRFLGISREALGNLWWLSNNPEIANFNTGP